MVPSVEPSSAAGPSARLVDTKASLFGHLPAAAVVIALVTFVLLFLMTGRIVTTAAALLAIVFVAFATSQVSFLKLFGVGTALAILVDATLIRALLVPAFMRLAGRANWWAPPPLRRLHARFGLAEAPGASGA